MFNFNISKNSFDTFNEQLELLLSVKSLLPDISTLSQTLNLYVFVIF